MARVEVLETSALAPLFICVMGDVPHPAAKVHYANKRYRTMLLERATDVNPSAFKDKRFWNWIQVAYPGAAQDLLFKYPDESHGAAPSCIAKIMECHNGKLAFGLGDLHPKAPFLFFKDRDSKEISAMLKWMRENLSDPALAIRHKYCLRVSFTDENDFVLARLKFG